VKIFSDPSTTIDFRNKVNLHYTGSMFGVGALADDKNALRRINFLKQRKSSKSFIILLSNAAELEKYAQINSNIKSVMDKFWPGDLTIILKTKRFEHLAINGFVAFRVPKSRFLRESLKNLPMVSTSVNISSESPEKSLEIIQEKYGHWFDFKIVPKKTTVSKNSHSTIIKIDNGILSLIRAGAISFEIVKQEWEKHSPKRLVK